jgi:hypothetical protein
VTSRCLSKHQGRTSISRCSSWTITALSSGDSTAWMSWGTLQEATHLSQQAQGRSSTMSEPCSDSGMWHLCPTSSRPLLPQRICGQPAWLVSAAWSVFLFSSVSLPSTTPSLAAPCTPPSHF